MKKDEALIHMTCISHPRRTNTPSATSPSHPQVELLSSGTSPPSQTRMPRLLYGISPRGIMKNSLVFTSFKLGPTKNWNPPLSHYQTACLWRACLKLIHPCQPGTCLFHSKAWSLCCLPGVFAQLEGWRGLPEVLDESLVCFHIWGLPCLSAPWVQSVLQTVRWHKEQAKMVILEFCTPHTEWHKIRKDLTDLMRAFVLFKRTTTSPSFLIHTLR